MTLLIALMGNELVRAQTGHVFIEQGWIIAIYVFHVIYHSGSKK